MKLPQGLALRLSPLVEAARGTPLVEPALELTRRDDEALVIESERGRFVLDRVRRVVLHDELEISSFDAIRSVDIGAFFGGRGEKSWSLTLYRRMFDRIALGRTYDDGDASVIGAQLARALGVKVVALASSR